MAHLNSHFHAEAVSFDCSKQTRTDTNNSELKMLSQVLHKNCQYYKSI